METTSVRPAPHRGQACVIAAVSSDISTQVPFDGQRMRDRNEEQEQLRPIRFRRRGRITWWPRSRRSAVSGRVRKPPQAAGSRSAFLHDPEINRECLWSGQVLRPSTLLVNRRGCVVKVRNDDGGWTIVTSHLSTFDSMMTHCADPRSTPEMLMRREDIPLRQCCC